MNYTAKYLKYKTKYLNLKYAQMGGNNVSNCNEIPDIKQRKKCNLAKQLAKKNETNELNTELLNLQNKENERQIKEKEQEIQEKREKARQELEKQMREREEIQNETDAYYSSQKGPEELRKVLQQSQDLKKKTEIEQKIENLKNNEAKIYKEHNEKPCNVICNETWAYDNDMLNQCINRCNTI
jgi:hypothetical protein